jgi:quercetin dioxygenase-like cupin family protein
MIRRSQRVSTVVAAPAVGILWLLQDLWLPALAVTSAQTMPAGITRTVLVDNATVLVARLRLAPGAREEPHTHPFSAVVVHSTKAYPAGSVFFLTRNVDHAVANASDKPLEFMRVIIR